MFGWYPFDDEMLDFGFSCLEMVSWGGSCFFVEEDDDFFRSPYFKSWYPDLSILVLVFWMFDLIVLRKLNILLEY